MKIPLIVMANPKHISEGPKVFLEAGKWEIESNSSNFRVAYYLRPDAARKLEDNCVVCEEDEIVYIQIWGDPCSISVSAKKVA